MKPPAFEFLRPETTDEALDALHRLGDEARVIAGGQSLVPMLNMRLARPSVLVDVMCLPALASIREEQGAVVVGAGVRQAVLERWPQLSCKVPLLAKAMGWIGHVQTRSRGTVCGSVAHADPSAELPLSLVALKGSVRLASRRKKRTLAASDFFLGMMSTAMAEGEMIEAVCFPVAGSGTGHAFREIGRRHGDFAIVACAAVADENSTTLAIAGVDDHPRRFDLPQDDGDGLDDALNDIAWSLNARDDLHASARYRRELVRRLGRETVMEARACRR
ncbi:FAD binding domain-containing protein [Oricola thermophila]|uniref:FAD binding domain-containing protein n=1 Tax=Oricola thermophila TaxID=2742145 RepID=A0A6N1V961_9HYPH|nr:FAD binding domain-containing protein [Oricola thermophila]QKV17043.1 FAD binding domain-containing protein [Oricola thermophila]